MKDTNEKKATTNVVEEIKNALEKLRPFLHMEGGDVEFISYDEEDKTVYVRLNGACAMCMAQDDTLEYGLLEAIREHVPEVENIVNSPL